MSQRPTLTVHFLEQHFAKTVRMRFFLGDQMIAADEVFDERMMLIPIAIAANDVSLRIYKREIVKGVLPDTSLHAPFGVRVELVDEINGLDLLLLVATAEELLGVNATAGDGDGEYREIDVMPILQEFAKPAGERKWH